MGKTSVKRLPSRGYREATVGEPWSLVDAPKEKRGAPAAFVAAEEYSVPERLELLIDALLLAVPTAHQVAQSALSGIAEFGAVDSVVFAADLPNRKPREIQREQLVSWSAEVAVVSRLLNELKAEL